MSPEVSVVIPAYNAARFIREAVDSVLAQTFTNFELIIVDDGSTDATVSILGELAGRDARIQLHPLEKNGGAIRARNHGVSLARGEFVAAMDADDICMPHRLERQVGLLRRCPDVGVVGAWVQLIDERGTPGAVKKYPSQRAVMAWSQLFVNCFAHPVVMTRRSLVAAAGGYAAECQGGTEDLDLFQRLSWSVRLATIEDVLLRYRRWAGSMTSTSWERQERDATRIVQNGISRLLGEPVEASVANLLRGLPVGRYPRTGEELSDTGRLIERMYERFVEQDWIDALDRRAVATDVGVKLWLLAALALRRAPSHAPRLAVAATRIRPMSFLSFAAKVASRLSSAGTGT